MTSTHCYLGYFQVSLVNALFWVLMQPFQKKKKKGLHSFQSSGHVLVHYKIITLALQNNRESPPFSAITGTNSYISMHVFCLLTYYRGRGIWLPSKGNFLLIPEISICNYWTLKKWCFIFISFYFFPKKGHKIIVLFNN